MNQDNSNPKDLLAKFDRNNTTQLYTPKLIVKFRDSFVDDMSSGRYMSLDKVNHTPVEVIYAPKFGGLYSIIMVDPDAPDPKNPSQSDWLNWMVLNIPEDRIQEGDTIAEYRPPSPSIGCHRYLIYLFYQASGKINGAHLTYKNICKTKNEDIKLRCGFDTKSFVKRYGLCYIDHVVFVNSPVTLMKSCSTKKVRDIAKNTIHEVDCKMERRNF
jgi:hypothetical protein